MGLKFRLRGLCETTIDDIVCPECSYFTNDSAILEKMVSEKTVYPTLQGLMVSVECPDCGHVYLPEDQKIVVLDPSEMRRKVLQDQELSGQLFWSREDVERDIRSIVGR